MISRGLKIKGLVQAKLWGTQLSDQDFLRVLKPGFANLGAFTEHLRKPAEARFFIQPQDQSVIIPRLRQQFPALEQTIITAADKAIHHTFDLLGSGPVTLGQEIDWHVDFTTYHRWSPRQYFAFARPAPYPGGHEIKIPWELSRCQHFAWMGQAYWFTGDEKYAREFVTQVTDWIEKNPPQWGVNWKCSMEVAIRAVNWLWGYYFFKDSPLLDDRFLISFYKSLLYHGRHIMQNLERSEALTTNHYLSNLVGLIYLGILLPGLIEAQTWKDFGLLELESEIFKQITPDGVCFEASTSYHRLDTELFLSATILAQLNGHRFSPEYLTRLEEMLEFILKITKPDGTVPLFGDQDNGRLHRLKVWEDANKEWTDFRYLLAIGAILFHQDDFACAAGEQREESIWLYTQQAFDFWEKFAQQAMPSEPAKSAIFPHAGIGILRGPDHYLAILAGPNGQNGVGGHAHNHALSYEFYANGQTWILDPGTYTYTKDYHARNTFRSTTWHNTISIDKEEINPIPPYELFALPDVAKAQLLPFEESEELIRISASHRGYNRLSLPVTHQRQVIFKKANPSVWWIVDHLDGSGPHHVLLSLQLTSTDAVLTRRGCRLTDQRGNGVLISFYSGLPMNVQLVSSRYSQGYGKCSANHALQYAGSITLPAKIITRLQCFSQATPRDRR